MPIVKTNIKSFCWRLKPIYQYHIKQDNCYYIKVYNVLCVQYIYVITYDLFEYHLNRRFSYLKSVNIGNWINAYCKCVVNTLIILIPCRVGDQYSNYRSFDYVRTGILCKCLFKEKYVFKVFHNMTNLF